jgi:Domain of unknown function (DUF4268)
VGRSYYGSIIHTNQLVSFSHLPEAEVTTQAENESVSISNINPNEEEPDPTDSRYAPLARWLESQSKSKVSLYFSEIETLIEDFLPPSARKHRNWWANDSVSHTQSQQWLEVGWRVSSVNMNLEKVEFKSIGERQGAYINFFSGLQTKLQSIPSLSFQNVSNPQGRNWFTFNIASNDGKILWFVLSFARRSRFRLELYIDTGEKSKNKAFFDKIHCNQENIESDFGQSIEWERLDSKRGSRIAFYRENSSINDSPEQLEEIQNWAIKYLPLFFGAISRALQR